MIDKYLISTCLFAIDEFNERFENKASEEIKEFADSRFCEADLVVRLGYPFRQMASFNMQGTARDIVVPKNDFIIEVKYLRNFKSNSGKNQSNKAIWENAFQKDYDWLCKEIIGGKKGHRTFVIGWFNAVNRFSELMQLGEGKGRYPDINKDRLILFPFLTHKAGSTKTKDIFYKYEQAFKEKPIPIPGHQEEVTCTFLGRESDLFHFAIYY